MSKYTTVWVYSDNATRLPELINAAKQHGEQINTFVLGNAQDIETAYALGTNTVYHLGDKISGRVIEDYAPTMAQAISQSSQPALVLLAATKRGKALGAKLAAQLQAGLINEASQIALDNQNTVAQHMIYGGLAFGQEVIKTPVAILTLGPGVYDPVQPVAGTSGQTVTLDYIAPKNSIKCLECKPKQSGSVDLGKAKRVIGIGRGIAKQEDIQMVQDLSALIGAEIGCSRPIAEGEKWMERERYIGVSGVMLKPEVYVALGISGQIQHMVGANSAQTIIAVNKDKNAPIFQYADYGLVGDLYKVVPALIAALKN